MKNYIKTCELYAKYWMAMATTGAATRRHVTRGDGHVLTSEELIREALNTALTHIDNLREASDKLCSLMNKQ